MSAKHTPGRLPDVEIMDMALEAGFAWNCLADFERESMGRFAEMVVAKERKRTTEAINSLKRADYRSCNIFRSYYPSTNGDWVCLRELCSALEAKATGGAA